MALDKDELKRQAKQKAVEAKEKAERAKIAQKRKKENISYVDMPEITGDAEVDSKADLDAVQQGFRDAIKREDKRFELATDSEYWTCLCFQSREQSEAFLKALDLLQYGDKYIDGRILAEKLGIELPDTEIPYRTTGKIDKDYLQFVD